MRLRGRRRSRRCAAGEDFAAVSAAFKRMKNIIAQAGFLVMSEIKDQDMGGTVPAQQALHIRAKQIGSRDYPHTFDGYVLALRELASIRSEVDAFFEQVMIMDPEPEVRLGRLRLLRALVEFFSHIADFSEIVTAG